jgi:hypothetical protein
LIQIVSGFLPDVDGMGDFSRRLAEELWRQKQIRSSIVVYRRPCQGGVVPESDAYQVSYPDAAEPENCYKHIFKLLGSSASQPVLLHWGPYAYTSNGLPSPFADMIENLSQRVRLLTLFHETWAHGWPWKRAFWTARNQRAAVEQILQSSAAAFTSSEFFQRRLDSFHVGHVPIARLRIFSNIGEIINPKPLQQRTRRLVVFGQKNTREALYRNHAKRLQTAIRNLGLKSILDVGSGHSSLIPDHLGDIPVERAGYLSEAHLSELLSDSVGGALQYGSEVWEKSGVLATYQSHGMVPILAPRVKDSFRPFPEMPFVLLKDISHARHRMDEKDLQLLADRCHRYYMKEVCVQHAAAQIASCMAD